MIASMGERAEISDSEDSESSVVRIGSVTSLRSVGSWIVNERTQNSDEPSEDFVFYPNEEENESREDEEKFPSEETPFLQKAEGSDIEETSILSEQISSVSQTDAPVECSQSIAQSNQTIQINPEAAIIPAIIKKVSITEIPTESPKRKIKTSTNIRGVFRRFSPKESAKSEKRRRRIRRRVDPAERVHLFLTNKWLRKNRHSAAPKYVRQSVRRVEEARRLLAEECGRLRKRLSERRSKTPKAPEEVKPQPTKTPANIPQNPKNSENSAPNFEYAIEFAAGSEDAEPRKTANNSNSSFNKCPIKYFKSLTIYGRI